MNQNCVEKFLTLHEVFMRQRKKYHVSAKLENVKSGDEYSDQELIGLFDSNDVRQVFHVIFGKF
jgi:hypothetical protein